MVDSLIRLFESTETSFETNGLGSLSEAISCEVVEERNGSFELEMEYHISGKRYPDLKMRRIIVAKPNPYSDPQPFRIYDISKPMNGLVTIKAEHISYDMSGYPVAPFSVSDVKAAISNAQTNAIVSHPFRLSTDMSASGEFTILKPVSMRSLLGGSDESILESYGGDGEYEFNGFDVILHQNRGTNRGVTIRYGKNMTDLNQEENCSNVYTAVYPFWYSDEWGLIELPEKTLPTAGTYDYVRIFPLDLSNEWENTYEWEDQYPSEDELRDLANKYISENNLGIPVVSLEVSFEQLSKSKEYETLSLLETVRLCDTVNVEFPALGVSATSKCIKTTYDVITNRYVSIELGESKSNLADTVATQSKTIEKQPTQTFMEKAIENATQLIVGGLGGYVVIRSSSGGKYPDEILIMDDPNIEKATKVWRWNKGGLGYSPTGYNGPYTTAITQDGSIVADFINTGHLTASIIQGGTLTVGGFDNTNGNIEVRDAENNLLIQMSVRGIEFYGEGSKPITVITNDTIRTTNVTAENLKVKAANVTGVLAIGQLPDDVAVTDDIPTDEEITVITNNTIRTTNVTAENLKVKTANILGSLTIGQLPDDVAVTDDIPTRNDIVTIINGTVTTYYMIANQVKAYSVDAENITGSTISGKTISGCTITGGTISIQGSSAYAKMDGNGFHGYYLYGVNNDDPMVDFSGSTGKWIIIYNNLKCSALESAKVHMSGDLSTDVGLRPLAGDSVRGFKVTCGSPNYRWDEVYCKKDSISTSDRNQKHNILPISQKYEELFHKIKPVSYMFNDGDRVHIGAISQDIEKIMLEVGLDNKEFAAFCKDQKSYFKKDEYGKETDELEYVFDDDGNPVYTYSLRYGEFIMLNTHMIQKAYKKIDEQQKEIDELKIQLNNILTSLKERGDTL